MEDIENVDVSKIEVTPEMIEAGEDALCSCDDAFSSKVDLEWIVTSVFLAMNNARGTHSQRLAAGHTRQGR